MRCSERCALVRQTSRADAVALRSGALHEHLGLRTKAQALRTESTFARCGTRARRPLATGREHLRARRRVDTVQSTQGRFGMGSWRRRVVCMRHHRFIVRKSGRLQAVRGVVHCIAPLWPRCAVCGLVLPTCKLGQLAHMLYQTLSRESPRPTVTVACSCAVSRDIDVARTSRHACLVTHVRTLLVLPLLKP